VELQRWVTPPSSGDHAGGRVDADRIETECRQVLRNVSRPAPDIADPPAGTDQFGEAGVQGPVDRLVIELVSQLVGVSLGDRVVTGGDRVRLGHRWKRTHDLAADRSEFRSAASESR
jgi:hypothetical protein